MGSRLRLLNLGAQFRRKLPYFPSVINALWSFVLIHVYVFVVLFNALLIHLTQHGWLAELEEGKLPW